MVKQSMNAHRATKITAQDGCGQPNSAVAVDGSPAVVAKPLTAQAVGRCSCHFAMSTQPNCLRSKKALPATAGLLGACHGMAPSTAGQRVSVLLNRAYTTTLTERRGCAQLLAPMSASTSSHAMSCTGSPAVVGKALLQHARLFLPTAGLPGA